MFNGVTNKEYYGMSRHSLQWLIATCLANVYMYNCEGFEPRSHFKSKLSLIVWVNVVLNRTVVVDND